MRYGGYLFQCGPLAPYPAEEMSCWPVSARVGNVKNNDPSLIEPIAAAA
jgi:putative SOS response-associated peptidase YedK